MKRKLKIGIIGPNKSACEKELYEFGYNLGKQISTENRLFFCGGAEGFMEAVCKGVKSSTRTFEEQTLGILQGDDPEGANSFIDIAIPTGIGIARNMIIINTSDILIAGGGGAGTLSEIAFAWQKKKIVLCVTEFNGWAKQLGGINLDKRQEKLLIPVRTIQEIELFLNKFEQII